MKFKPQVENKRAEKYNKINFPITIMRRRLMLRVDT